MNAKPTGPKTSRKERDPDLVNAEIALRRAAQRARLRAQKAGIGVMVIKDGKMVEEKPSQTE